MNVHNVMEGIVLETVNEIFEDKKKDGFEMADCLQCRLDVACYVLNRIKPEYIISGRGLLHFEDNYHNYIQTKVDMVTLINEGIKRVEKIRRPYYTVKVNTRNVSTRYVFNFPSIIGTVLLGTTFMPAENTQIALYQNNELAQMIDNTWQNPFMIVRSIKGSYSFMPAPVAANEANESKTFEFELRIDDGVHEPVHHFLEIPLKSEEKLITTFSMNRTYRQEEIYLFPRDKDQPT